MVSKDDESTTLDVGAEDGESIRLKRRPGILAVRCNSSSSRHFTSMTNIRLPEGRFRFVRAPGGHNQIGRRMRQSR